MFETSSPQQTNTSECQLEREMDGRTNTSHTALKFTALQLNFIELHQPCPDSPPTANPPTNGTELHWTSL